jgi:hypothetical protein
MSDEVFWLKDLPEFSLQKLFKLIIGLPRVYITEKRKESVL